MEVSKIYCNKSAQFSGLGAKRINLRYVASKYGDILPETISHKMSEILNSGSSNMPTFRELHLRTYAPLSECQTLGEAKSLFPEFASLLDANDVLSPTGEVISIILKHCPKEALSLKLLQDIWGKLKSPNEVAQGLGLTDYQKLVHIKKKIRFPNMSHAHIIMLKASDPVMNAQMAAKTTAYNAQHRDLMLAHNRRAIKLAQTPEARKKRGAGIRLFYDEHPEERQRVSSMVSMVWDRLPHIKETLKKFLEEHFSHHTRIAIHKKLHTQNATEGDIRMVKVFFKRFWEAHPEFKKEYADTWSAVAAEIQASKTKK